MTHYYEKNIVDIKNEYLTYLTDVLVPLIYEGIQSIYNHASEQSRKFDEFVSDNATAKNPGITKIFQACLKDVPSLSAGAIEIEVKRIKEFSRCSEWFDDLIKAVIKSYIILLTFNSSGKTCKLVNEKYHEKVNINEFIHKCYIECSVVFFNNPELFWTEQSHETDQLCKKSAYKYIRQCIIDAIHKTLPIKLILQEYLSNDYIVEHSKKSKESEISEHSHHSHYSRHSPVNGFRKLTSEEHHSDLSEHHEREIIREDHDVDTHVVRDHLSRMIDDDKNNNGDLSDVPHPPPVTQQVIQPTNPEPIIPEQENKIPEMREQLDEIPQINPELEPIRQIQDVRVNTTKHEDKQDKVLNEHEIDDYFRKYTNDI